MEGLEAVTGVLGTYFTEEQESREYTRNAGLVITPLRTTLKDPLLSSYPLPTKRLHNLEEQRHILGNKLVKT